MNGFRLQSRVVVVEQNKTLWSGDSERTMSFCEKLCVIIGVFAVTASPADADISLQTPYDKTIKIGYLLGDSQPPYRIGAIQLAIDKARAEGRLAGYNIR